jgi:DNA helicase IV
MDSLIAFFVIGIFALTFIGYKARQKRKEKKEEERRKYLERYEREKREIEKYLSAISKFNDDLMKLLTSNQYIAGFDLFRFRKEYKTLRASVDGIVKNHLTEFTRQIKSIKSFQDEFDTLETKVDARNKRFVKEEKSFVDSMLSDVEGRSLDMQQRTSILTDEDNCLIIAGAGAGKTTTIAGKVKYLIERKKINPENILLISFTRKSADEMQERIRNKMGISIRVKTFHKLGLDIIAEISGEKPSILDLNRESIFKLTSSFIEEARKNDKYNEAFLEYLSFYSKPYRDSFEFDSEKEHEEYLKNQKLEGFRKIKIGKGDSAYEMRERFKSQEEVLLANFLFINRIEYKYEDSFEYKTASKTFSQYKPDFYLPDYDIYLEHFGIDRDGNVPDWFKGKGERSAKEVYNEGIEWKRAEHDERGTTMVETYSYEQREGVLLTNLQQKLVECGVVFNPLTNEELWDYLSKNLKEEVNALTDLMYTFLVLFKSNNEIIENLTKRASRKEDVRALKFLKLFNPVYEQYQQFLEERNEIDFSDMINVASSLIVNKSFESPYQYILIDEFQDISNSRYQLIKALLDQEHGTKLFCVGDDWQSIYRFTGSDIGLFTKFQTHFRSSSLVGYNRKTHLSKIEKTYRFAKGLIDVSGDFIMRNPNQIPKTLKSDNKDESYPLVFHRYSDPDRKKRNAPGALQAVLQEIMEEMDRDNESILLLGRYTFDWKNISSDSLLQRKYNNQKGVYDYSILGHEDVNITFLTVHSAKGLEADYVVILNAESGTYGFPSEIADDPLLGFLLSEADQFPNGEERRLFYVALTRAKRQVHILVSEDYPSKFVEELDPIELSEAESCEWCETGKLVLRSGPYGEFLACNNIHYCNYTRKVSA